MGMEEYLTGQPDDIDKNGACSETQLVDAFAVDSHCFGHTMELVPSGQAVRWLNPVNGVGVYLSPGAKSDTCRYSLRVTCMPNRCTASKGRRRKPLW